MTTTSPAHEWNAVDPGSAQSGDRADESDASGGSGVPGVIVAGRDADGRRLPPLRERLCPPMPSDRLLGWLVPGLIALFAGIPRFVNLGYPAKFVIDETYYPKDAFSLLNFGVERQFVDHADDRILAGDFDVFGGPAFIVHPPAGKWVIAAGEWVFGMNPFGW
ncbi:MAG TPA: hypothetical protein VI076_11885, partial [Actinopolymorphaceae bacterium]